MTLIRSLLGIAFASALGVSVGASVAMADEAGGQTVATTGAAQEAQWRAKLDPIDTSYVDGVPNGAAILSSYRQLLAPAKTK